MAAEKSLLIFVPRLTNRLGYTLKVLLRHILQLDFEITEDADFFLQEERPKMSYGDVRMDNAPWIKAHDLLFETSICEQEIQYAQYEGYEAPFAVYGHDLDFPFDMLAATFYLVSRYEEYLPHRCDEHGRFLADDCMAFQRGFLNMPVVDLWAMKLEERIQERFPDFVLPQRRFDMETTIDIDAAYCYKHKGLIRNILGAMRDGLYRHDWYELRRRIRVLSGKEKDPFDTFDYILHLFRTHPRVRLIFFALMADYGMNDKPISYHNPEFLQLLQHLDDFAKMGIHVGYNSFLQSELIDIELARLSNTIHRNVVHNRCHFLRLAMPGTYRSLIHAGIMHDYTMGYACHTGFRASISTPYPFYDLSNDMETSLTIHPFACMDTTLHRHLLLSTQQAWSTIKELMDSVAAVKGTFSCIFHNENLSETFGWQGWQNVYEKTILYGEQLIQQGDHGATATLHADRQSLATGIRLQH